MKDGISNDIGIVLIKLMKYSKKELKESCTEIVTRERGGKKYISYNTSYGLENEKSWVTITIQAVKL